MANRDDILSELKKISLTVANIGNENPFRVPLGYFEALPGLIINRINNGDEVERPLPWPKPVQNEPFEVPAAYFEELAQIVLSRIKASEALSHKEELQIISPLLDNLEKKVPFNLPAGYFEEFPADIIAGVNAIDYVNHELETSSVTINDLKDKNVFKVPEGYFNDFANELLLKIKVKQKGRVLQLMPVKKVIRYAVAALFAGVISVSAWVFFQDKQTVNAAADISGIEKISNDEIEKYLETSSVAPADGNIETNSIASSDLKEEDVKELLADVSDEELQQYLDEHAVAKDLKTN